MMPLFTATTRRGPDGIVPTPASASAPGRRAARLDAIDMLRGLMIVLMVLDHVRDFFTAPINPLALDSGNPALFLTRWITHLCAPTFVFLAGVSVWLQQAAGGSRRDLSSRLATRGLWLILLELTVIGFGFNFGWWIFLQVIWAIGVGMIVLSMLVWLPRRAVLALGIAIVALHPLLASVAPDGLGGLTFLWRSLAVFGPTQTAAGFALIAYPAIPWLGVLLLGYGVGFVFTLEHSVRRKAVFALAVAGLASFGLLRGWNVAGLDPRPWATQADVLWTMFSFINVSKYPPSPGFVLVTLSVSLLLYLGLERVAGLPSRILLTFGRTALASYLAHIWLAHWLALLVGVPTGIDASAFANSIADPSRLTAAGWGFGLPIVYVAWAATLVLLYPLARRVEWLKAARRDWWLRYI